MPKLHVYASGDGSLSLCWSDSRGYATGEPVTREQAIDCLLNDPKQKHLRENGWRVWVNGKREPCFVPDVKRKSKINLLVQGQEYTYSLNEFAKNDFIPDCSLTLTFLFANERYDVKNLNTRSAVCFFLNNEKALQEFPPDDSEYALA